MIDISSTNPDFSKLPLTFSNHPRVISATVNQPTIIDRGALWRPVVMICGSGGYIEVKKKGFVVCCSTPPHPLTAFGEKNYWQIPLLRAGFVRSLPFFPLSFFWQRYSTGSEGVECPLFFLSLTGEKSSSELLCTSSFPVSPRGLFPRPRFRCNKSRGKTLRDKNLARISASQLRCSEPSEKWLLPQFNFA